MRISAIVVAALVAGNASAGVTCEGPHIKLIEQDGKALITVGTAGTFSADCTSFYTPFEHQSQNNLKVCKYIWGRFESLEVLVIEPRRILMIPVANSMFPEKSPEGLVYEATCSGFDDE
ncbi:hypothetical protein [Ruegeria arenilitoris]|uniref:hypothetical protein n=1 Tax=Ruegeria arenilitoris TaxID=1173585 RepID=UPI001480F8B1|nr:hypothetical protein [Ruegeria arenilitoris]